MWFKGYLTRWLKLASKGRKCVNSSTCRLRLVVLSICLQQRHSFASHLSSSGHSHVGSLFTNEEHKQIISSTHVGLIHDITNTDCRAQIGSPHGCVLFANSKRRFLNTYTIVQFSSVPWPIGWSGEHEGRFSRDPLQVFPAILWFVSDPGMGRDVHSLMVFIQHFLYRPRRRPPPKVTWSRL